jgi:hypothetical protein
MYMCKCACAGLRCDKEEEEEERRRMIYVGCCCCTLCARRLLLKPEPPEHRALAAQTLGGCKLKPEHREDAEQTT